VDPFEDRIIIRLWGEIGPEWGSAGFDNMKGKGKAKESMYESRDSEGWRVIAEWDVDISRVLPLPDEVSLVLLYSFRQTKLFFKLSSHNWRLPANALIISFGPFHQQYYLPETLLGISPTPSRTNSPDYNSDTEIVRGGLTHSRRRMMPFDRGRLRKSRKDLKSANVNELIK
jgi:UV radiation resistance-associated gene protein